MQAQVVVAILRWAVSHSSNSPNWYCHRLSQLVVIHRVHGAELSVSLCMSTVRWLCMHLLHISLKPRPSSLLFALCFFKYVLNKGNITFVSTVIEGYNSSCALQSFTRWYEVCMPTNV